MKKSAFFNLLKIICTGIMILALLSSLKFLEPIQLGLRIAIITLALLLAALFAALCLRDAQRLRRVRRGPRAPSPTCGYDLHAHLPPLNPHLPTLPPRCPECGTPIPSSPRPPNVQ